VELIQSDEAGSIADLGLKPGGRVRMTQTSFIQIKQSINMARLEHQNIYKKKIKSIFIQRFNSSI
jgi:hypothetical protein